jgi:hypothetical protein
MTCHAIGSYKNATSGPLTPRLSALSVRQEAVESSAIFLLAQLDFAC